VVEKTLYVHGRKHEARVVMHRKAGGRGSKKVDKRQGREQERKTRKAPK